MILVHEKDFPFNLKTSKDLKVPERKPRPKNTRRPTSKPYGEGKTENNV
jgi:hypothetical protein